MPRHLISDAHEWINEIPTVPIYPISDAHEWINDGRVFVALVDIVRRTLFSVFGSIRINNLVFRGSGAQIFAN